jgi:hypothetical protein
MQPASQIDLAYHQPDQKNYKKAAVQRCKPSMQFAHESTPSNQAKQHQDKSSQPAVQHAVL